MPRKRGEALRLVLGWPGRFSFTPADLAHFLGSDVQHHIKSWLRKGFIRRIDCSLYTTELGSPNVVARMLESEVKEFLATLPSEFNVYQFKTAYNTYRGAHLFDRAILTRWKAKGFISKGTHAGMYINNIKGKDDEQST